MVVSPLSDKATETLRLLIGHELKQALARLSDATFALGFVKEASDDAEQQATMGKALVLIERAQALLGDGA